MSPAAAVEELLSNLATVKTFYDPAASDAVFLEDGDLATMEPMDLLPGEWTPIDEAKEFSYEEPSPLDQLLNPKTPDSPEFWENMSEGFLGSADDTSEQPFDLVDMINGFLEEQNQTQEFKDLLADTYNHNNDNGILFFGADKPLSSMLREKTYALMWGGTAAERSEALKNVKRTEDLGTGTMTYCYDQQIRRDGTKLTFYQNFRKGFLESFWGRVAPMKKLTFNDGSTLVLLRNELPTADILGQMNLTVSGGNIIKTAAQGLKGKLASGSAKSALDDAAQLADDVVKETSSTTAKQLLANQIAGKSAEVRAAQELVAEGNKILGSQVSVRTSLGRRVIDHLIQTPTGEIIAVEVKSGNATRNAMQLAKDAALANEGGVLVGKNVPEALRGLEIIIKTIVRQML